MALGAGKSLPPFCVTSALAWPRCTLDGWGLLCHSRQGPESQRGVSASSRAARTVPAQVTAGWPCSSGLAASPLALRVLPLCVPVPQPNPQTAVPGRPPEPLRLGSRAQRVHVVSAQSALPEFRGEGKCEEVRVCVREGEGSSLLFINPRGNAPHPTKHTH